MHFHDLSGRAVVAVAEARTIGNVDSLFVDTGAQRVLGIRLRTNGFIVRHEAIRLNDVQSIGADAVTIPDASKSNAQNTFPELKDLPDLGPILGARVLNERGEHLGSVADVDVDLDAGTITGYVLGGNIINRLRHDQQTVPVAQVKSVGNSMVVVTNDVTVS